MKNNPAGGSPAETDLNAMNQGIMASIRTQQRRIYFLTAGALVFGFFAIVTSVAIVGGYFLLFRPKQMQMMNDFQMRSGPAMNNPNQPGLEPGDPRARYDFPHVQVMMTRVVSIGTMLVAVAVGSLALGTLVMLALLFSQRRATLQQINATLAQISEQLRELRQERGGGP